MSVLEHFEQGLYFWTMDLVVADAFACIFRVADTVFASLSKVAFVSDTGLSSSACSDSDPV